MDNDTIQIARAIGTVIDLIDGLKSVRDAHRGDDSGRYTSLAITELESAAHWLADAQDSLPA
jgi:hypothetical protein